MRWKRGGRVKLVSENDAPSRTREIFREVRDSLGIPVVPKLYEAYAATPEFLDVHWRAFRPAVQSRQFFLLGARLAAESYTRAHNYFGIRPLRRREASAPTQPVLSLPQVLDYYQYLDPLLLLIAAAQMQAFADPVGQSAAYPEPTSHPDFAVAPSLACQAEASPGLQRSWNERERLLELTVISDEHRALTCWPEFYVEYWTMLKDLLQSPVYADCQYRLADSALTMTAELPVRVETSNSQLVEAGLKDEQITSAARINEAFVQALTGLVLDITFARIGLEGGTAGEQASHIGPTADSTTHTSGSPVRAA